MAEQIAGTNKARRGSSAPEGLLLLDKKPGLTSFEALSAVKRALGASKAGHTGTLDKFARGLLPVLVGRAVKLSPWFFHAGKEYTGRIRFGIETDTLDPEGRPAAEAPLPSREAVEAVLPQFRGEILQAPPAYSAIHLGGRRASELARAGEAPRMQKRPVHIYRLELTGWDPPCAEIRVHCSSGVYIRSLARDLALAAGSRAHLIALTRTRFAGFELSRAVSCNRDDPEARSMAADALMPIDRAIVAALGLPWFDISPEQIQNFIHGKPLSQILAGQELFHPRSGPDYRPPGTASGPGEKQAAGVFCGECFAGIIEQRPGVAGWSYGCVYAAGEGNPV